MRKAGHQKTKVEGQSYKKQTLMLTLNDLKGSAGIKSLCRSHCAYQTIWLSFFPYKTDENFSDGKIINQSTIEEEEGEKYLRDLAPLP